MTRFMVEAVRIDSVDVSTLGGHHEIVRGQTFVDFRSARGDSITLDWTHRGDPPEVGSRWVLVEEAT